MRAAAMPGALAVAVLTVPVACGPARQPAEARAVDGSSARFRDVTNYVVEGEKADEVEKGAFDWATRQGWRDSSYRGSSGSLLQVGDDCFHRDAGGTWKHWRVTEYGSAFCDPDLFQRPQELLATLSSNGTLDRVGPEKIGGVSTIHYRYVPSPEDTDNPEAWVEIWLDENKIVHRLERPAGEASPRVRDYFDFGVDVHVTPPCRPRQAATHPAPGLSGEKQQSDWCVEDTG